MKQRVIRVCMTPALYPLYMEDNNIVVIVDILRATSAICAALQHGVKEVIPVAAIQDGQAYQGQAYIHAAERGGEVVEGFRYGNSPLSYIDNEEVKNKSLVLTTTNGTQAIEAARGHGRVVIGAFSNLSALSQWILTQEEDVMVLCAGWKNRFNLEDSLFAGALVERLIQEGFSYDIDSDAALAAQSLYQLAKADIYGFLHHSSHRNRLVKLELEEDVHYCLTIDTCKVVPVLNGFSLLAEQVLV